MFTNEAITAVLGTQSLGGDRHRILDRLATSIGEAHLRFVVERNGVVSGTVLVSSSHREFEAPALEAINQWQFEAGRKSGRTVRSQMDIPLVFQRP